MFPQAITNFYATTYFKRTIHQMPSNMGNTMCAGAPSPFGAYCGAFRTTPCASSWAPPLVAPSRTNPVTEPSGYRFASRAPVVRRSPTAGKASVKRSRSGTAHCQKPSSSSLNRRQSASSSRRPPTGTAPESAEPGYQYDEFLASFQRRIDGMTGQSGGWGF